jgi:hypothetical protein
MLLAAVFVAAFAQQAPAQTAAVTASAPFMPPGLEPRLVGTTGACNNVHPGGPCTQNSTLVLLDPKTGALIRTIGPVGFTVNGLAWDRTTKTLYATTAIGCGLAGSVCPFHGLIKIAPNGKGTPVNPNAVNFGIEGGDVGVGKLAIDVFGNVVASYPIPPPPATEVDNTYVRIDPKTGIATEHPNTGINTARDGLSFGEFNLLWDVDDLNHTAFLLNPFTGTSLFAQPVNPPTMAALGDFNPVDHLYYGLQFGADPTGATVINVIDVPNGTVIRSMPTANFLHTLTWVDK